LHFERNITMRANGGKKGIQSGCSSYPPHQEPSTISLVPTRSPSRVPDRDTFPSVSSPWPVPPQSRNLPLCRVLLDGSVCYEAVRENQPEVRLDSVAGEGDNSELTCIDPGSWAGSYLQHLAIGPLVSRPDFCS
jgi:hypothetical protein